MFNTLQFWMGNSIDLAFFRMAAEDVRNDCNLLRIADKLPVNVLDALQKYYSHVKVSGPLLYGDSVHSEKNSLVKRYKDTLQYWQLVELVLVYGWQHRRCSNHHKEIYKQPSRPGNGHWCSGCTNTINVQTKKDWVILRHPRTQEPAFIIPTAADLGYSVLDEFTLDEKRLITTHLCKDCCTKLCNFVPKLYALEPLLSVFLPIKPLTLIVGEYLVCTTITTHCFYCEFGIR